MNRPLRLYVYNNEYDVTRMITITPHRHWGGNGSLGCVLGFGALHRVPAALAEPTNAPGETMFEASRFSNEESSRPVHAPRSANASPAPAANGLAASAPPPSGGDFLVPANMTFNTTSPLSPSGPPMSGALPERKKKARVNHANPMEDYFKEGEEKSAEMEGTARSGGSRNNALPPPPTGGPPRAGPPRSGKSPAPAASPAPVESAAPVDGPVSTGSPAPLATEDGN